MKRLTRRKHLSEKVTAAFLEAISYILRVDPFLNCFVKVTGLLSRLFAWKKKTASSIHFLIYK